jgi:hypothetical protein
LLRHTVSDYSNFHVPAGNLPVTDRGFDQLRREEREHDPDRHSPKHLTPPHPINVDASVIFAATKQRLSSAREIRA